jgi:hypothetical protein
MSLSVQRFVIPPVTNNKSAQITAVCSDWDGKQFGILLGATSSPWPDIWPGLTDNEDKKGGKQLHFYSGRLVSRTRDTPPILVYEKIYDLWNTLGGIACGLGYPLADPRFLPDRSICSVFEGGHVHQIGIEDAKMWVTSSDNLSDDLKSKNT